MGRHPSLASLEHDVIYSSYCLALQGEASAVDWAAFAPVDWETWKKRVQAEGVAPLLYHTLTRAGWPEGVPADVQAWLQAAFYTNTSRNLLLYKELARVLAALETAEIPALVLKGPVLAATVYEHIGLRPITDLDLLVPEAQLAAAIETTVRGLRYSPYGGPQWTAGVLQLLSPEANFFGGEHLPLRVELHWTLLGAEAGRYRPPAVWFWEHTETVALPEARVTLLQPAAHILYLAAHYVFRHRGAQERLIWLCDLRQLIECQSERWDWDELARNAQALGWSAAVQVALQDTQDRLGKVVPGGLLERLARDADPQAARLIARRADPHQTRTMRLWDRLSGIPWWPRLRLLAAALVPNPEFMHYRYRLRPAWLWPLGYAIRWLDVLREAMVTLRRVGMDRIGNIAFHNP